MRPSLGLSYSHIVNAAFTQSSPLGNRFNDPGRGARYAGFSRKTAEIEVAYHRSQELKEVRWAETEVFAYVDFLAEFRGNFMIFVALPHSQIVWIHRVTSPRSVWRPHHQIRDPKESFIRVSGTPVAFASDRRLRALLSFA